MPQSDISTSSKPTRRTNGGATRGAVAIPNNTSGNFGAPTIWEFKVADESNVTTADIKRRGRQAACPTAPAFVVYEAIGLKAWLTFRAVARSTT
jgi:hypothetical protein